MGHKSMVASITGPHCLTTGAGDRRHCEGYQRLIAEWGKCEPTSCAPTPGGWHVTWAMTAAALSDGRPCVLEPLAELGRRKRISGTGCRPTCHRPRRIIKRQ
jgi:hypothetical protein